MLKRLLAKVTVTVALAAGCVVAVQAPPRQAASSTAHRRVARATWLRQRPDRPVQGPPEGTVKGTFVCSEPTAVWGCFKEPYGWFDPSSNCYYNRLDPQPPASDIVWQSNYPNGAIYQAWCIGSYEGYGPIWRATAPPGYGGTYDYATAAAQAINSLDLEGPTVRTAPGRSSPGVAGLVGLPVWLWTPAGATTWATPTPTKSATAKNITVSAYGTAQSIVWSMGDGNSVTCANPGTAYSASYEGAKSPTCGYLYTQPSRGRSGGVYTITATTTWIVTWWVSGGGGGISGTVTITRSSTTTLRIDELQVVTW